jgi:hypothetical protein
MTIEVSNITADAQQESRNALFQLLTEEIKDRHEEAKLAGWTPWLVSGALISIVWLTIQDSWRQPLQTDSVRAVFLLVSLLIMLIVDVRGTLSSFGADRARGQFLLAHTKAAPVSALTLALWFGAIAAACLVQPRLDPNRSLIITGIFVSFLAVVALLIIPMAAFRMPFPSSRGRVLPHLVTTALTSVLYAFAILAIWKSNAMVAARVMDLRAGGLFALGAYGLFLLSRGQGNHSVITDILVDLRRDLVLGNLSIDEAHHRTRTILQGMFLSDVVRDDMRALLKLISDVRALYAEAIAKIETLKTALPIASPSVKQLADFEKVAVSNTLDVLKVYEQRASGIAKQYFAQLKSLKWRLNLASRVVKAAASDEAKMITEIERAQQPADKDLARFIKEFLEIQGAWNVWFPGEVRNHQPFDNFP